MDTMETGKTKRKAGACCGKTSGPHRLLPLTALAIALCGMALLVPSPVAAAATVTPHTWNVIGLDSNTPAFGPYVFPVGARICSAAAAETVRFEWTDGLGLYNGNLYINLRSGSSSAITVNTAGGCADAYFEVEVARTSAAFDRTRAYRMYTDSGAGSPTPRELYVEHLVSQSRNGIDNVKLNGVSIPPGGAMNLIVGNTYTIELTGHTAPGGYNQFEEFINFPNTIFQIQSVSTTYTADDSPYVPGPNPALYGDACLWDNDPNSPYYLSCIGGDYKVGGTVVTTYMVTILSSSDNGKSKTLNSLLYDFSGSSFHYNADYSTAARIANIIDPTNMTFTKRFSPNPTNAGGMSTLLFTITNPNAGAVSGLNFIDTYPAGMNNDTIPSTSTTCGSSAVITAPSGTNSISFSNGTVPANGTCTVQVNVTAGLGTYSNASGHLYAGTVDTCAPSSANCVATADLTVNNSIPLPPPVCGIVLAKWTFPTGFNTTAPAPSTAIVSASAAAGAGLNPTNAAASSTADGTGSWISNGSVTTGTPLAATNNDYFEFAVNTTGYSSVYLNFNAQRKVNNSPRGIAVYKGTSPGNPETGTSLYDNPTVLAANTTWYPFGAGNSLPLSAVTGTSYARIYAYNSGNTNPGSDVYVDDVTITACGIPSPPTITKAFSPNPVPVSGASTLTFTINNPNAGVGLTGISFRDPLISGLTVTTGTSSQCGGTLTKTAPDLISFASGTLAAGASCTITATVTATTAGPHSNVTDFIYSTQTGTNAAATGAARASLNAVLPPQISKQFETNPILTNGVTKLTFLLTNPNVSDDLTNVSFSDAFPASPGAMKVYSLPATNTCGGTVTDAGGGALVAGASTSIKLANGAIPAGGSCQVSVNVTAPVQSQPVKVQSITNNTTLVLEAGYGGGTASDLAAAKDVVSALTGTVSAVNGSTTVTGAGTKFLTEVTAGSTIYIGTYKNTSGLVTAGTNTGNSATAYLTVSEPHPQITLFKEIATSNTGTTVWGYYLAVPVGGSVYYSFQVQNDGDVPLTSVSVTDNDLPPPLTMNDCSWHDGDGNSLTPPFTLAAPVNGSNADFATCVIGPVSVISPGTVTNNAAAAGTANSRQYTDTDWAMYETTELSLVSSVTPTYFTGAGNSIAYSYTVTNNGAARLSGPVTVTLTAAGAGTAPTVSCPALTTAGDHDNYFDPGESITCTSSVYTAVAADATAATIPNTAYASTAAVGSTPGAVSNTVNTPIDMAYPNLMMLKTVQVLSDSYSATNPKAIPGAVMQYTVSVSNQGLGIASHIKITDSMPNNTIFFVGDMPSGSGPVLFTDGTTPSGLTYSFLGLESGADDIWFSNSTADPWNSDTDPWNYTPTDPDGDGFDPDVKHIKVSWPSGAISGASGGNTPSFTMMYRIKVQ